jgi:hypothetical protein
MKTAEMIVDLLMARNRQLLIFGDITVETSTPTAQHTTKQPPLGPHQAAYPEPTELDTVTGLHICDLSHGDRTGVCLTQHFISYDRVEPIRLAPTAGPLGNAIGRRLGGKGVDFARPLNPYPQSRMVEKSLTHLVQRYSEFL